MKRSILISSVALLVKGQFGQSDVILTPNSPASHLHYDNSIIPSYALRHGAIMPNEARNAALNEAENWRDQFVRMVYTPEGKRMHGHDWRVYQEARQHELELFGRLDDGYLAGMGADIDGFAADWQRYAEDRVAEKNAFEQLHGSDAMEGYARYEEARSRSDASWERLNSRGLGGDEWMQYAELRRQEAQKWRELREKYGYGRYEGWAEYNPFREAAKESAQMWREFNRGRRNLLAVEGAEPRELQSFNGQSPMSSNVYTGTRTRNYQYMTMVPTYVPTMQYGTKNVVTMVPGVVNRLIPTLVPTSVVTMVNTLMPQRYSTVYPQQIVGTTVSTHYTMVPRTYTTMVPQEYVVPHQYQTMVPTSYVVTRMVPKTVTRLEHVERMVPEVMHTMVPRLVSEVKPTTYTEMVPATGVRLVRTQVPEVVQKYVPEYVNRQVATMVPAVQQVPVSYVSYHRTEVPAVVDVNKKVDYTKTVDTYPLNRSSGNNNGVWSSYGGNSNSYNGASNGMYDAQPGYGNAYRYGGN